MAGAFVALTPQRLLDSVARMQAWRDGNRPASTVDLFNFIELDRPRIT